MKFDNIKQEVTQDMKSLEKRMKLKHKNQWEATPAD
jgi:hypothetical protein